MFPSPETTFQHKRPHKLLDRLFLNNCDAARASLPFRVTPVREGALYGSNIRWQGIVRLFFRGVCSRLNQLKQVVAALAQAREEEAPIHGTFHGKTPGRSHIVLHARHVPVDQQGGIREGILRLLP